MTRSPFGSCLCVLTWAVPVNRLNFPHHIAYAPEWVIVSGRVRLPEHVLRFTLVEHVHELTMWEVESTHLALLHWDGEADLLVSEVPLHWFRAPIQPPLMALSFVVIWLIILHVVDLQAVEPFNEQFGKLNGYKTHGHKSTVQSGMIVLHFTG